MTVRPKFYSFVSCSSLLATLVLVSLGFGYSPNVKATTYYVRTDGGTPAQCNGTANNPYSAASAPSCAWSTPNYALPLGKGTTTPQRIKGGDTLSIGPGTYKIGAGAPGSEGCYANAPYDCFSKPVPSGTSTARTRIVGTNSTTVCASPPKLVGVGADLYAVLNLEGSSDVEVSCLEITDDSQCIKAHNHFGTARGETSRCGTSDNYAQYGIVSRNSSNVQLTALNIHGLAVNGIRAGKLTNWTLDGVKLVANGWAGWDGDIAPGDQTASSNSGNIIFRKGEIAWNGCGERLDSVLTKFGCWAQENGGYGDGLGTGRTGGNWLFEDMNIHHNTSDGLDLLYMNGTGNVTVRRVRSQGNAGNQIKVAGTSLIENSIAISNCAFFATFPTSNLTGGENCRAMGNALSVNLIDNSVATVRHNTVTGEGDCQLITVGGNILAKVLVQNNAFLGDTEWQSRSYGPELSCGHYAESSVASVVFENNLFWNVKNNQCPSGSICGKDPRLTRTAYESYDATPMAGSPLIDSAITLPAVITDFFNRVRLFGPKPDIGAIEVQPVSSAGRVTGGVLPASIGSAAPVASGSQPSLVNGTSGTPIVTGSSMTSASVITPWRSRGAILFNRAAIAAARVTSRARAALNAMGRVAWASLDSIRASWETYEESRQNSFVAAAAKVKALAMLSVHPRTKVASPAAVLKSPASLTGATAASDLRTSGRHDQDGSHYDARPVPAPHHQAGSKLR